jgi:DNA-binding MarR family transcriptional regulator
MNTLPSAAGTVPTRMRTLPSWLIGRLNAQSHKLLVDEFAEAGFRAYHYRILAALKEWGPASQADLGRSTSIDASDMVAALNELEQMRLVKRSPDPDHGRRKVVSLTRDGAAQLRQLERVLDRIQVKVLAPLTRHERSQFMTLMTKLTS